MIDRSDYPRLREVLCKLLGCPCGTPSVAREEPLDDTYVDAFLRLQNASVLDSENYRRRLKVDYGPEGPRTDDIRRFTETFVRKMAAYSVPFFPHGVYRSDEEQEALFKQGVTKARAGQSAHNYGMAVDLVHYGHYWDLTRKEWNLVGEFGKDLARSMALKVTWGGDFKSLWDPAHWELTDWKSYR